MVRMVTWAPRSAARIASSPQPLPISSTVVPGPVLVRSSRASILRPLCGHPCPHARPGPRPQPDRRQPALPDLALNAAWTPLFFRARRPRAALAEIACLNAANALLIRQTWQADRTAVVLLLPYAGWTAFATALSAKIVRLNPGR